MSKILYIEDDTRLAELVIAWLNSQKHVTEHVDTGKEGLERLKIYEYDIVVMDWELPDLTGPQICREFRDGGGATPVLLLTGRSHVDDKESGFDSGADDYLTKPFDMKELSARIRALVRRSNNEVTKTVLQAGDVKLDPRSRQVFVNDVEISLQPKELALLEFLMRHPAEPFSAETILNRVWSSESEAAPDTVRLHIMRIRQKIDEKGKESLIRTVHRVGYMLVPPEG